MSSADGVQLEKLTSLRAIVGEEAREQDLIALLARHNGDVEAAANTFFDHGIDGTAPAAAAPVQGTPPIVARPVAPSQAPAPVAPAAAAQNQDLVHVVCPAGSRAGDSIQVETPSGAVRVQVPSGISAGDAFLVRVPNLAQNPVAHVAQASAQIRAAGYQQPNVVVVQSPRGVYGRPYRRCGYGYGYRYGRYDGVAVGAGVLGGLLIADAFLL